MRWMAAFPLAAAAALAAAGEEPAPAKLFGASCASCHAVPDPALAVDRPWIDQVRRTAWSSTPAGAREALVAWLSAKDTARPRRIEDAADLEGKAILTANFKSGTLVLTSKEDSVALCWKEDDKDRRRGIPPGKWDWRSTRIEMPKDGEAWILSSCQGKAPAFRFKAGGDPPMQLVAGVKAVFAGKAKRNGGVLELGFDLKDDQGMGISVYRKGLRIDVRWRLLGKDGSEIAAGSMTYGWGGGGWARVEPPKDAAPEAVEFLLDTGPFPLSGTTKVAVK